jgi:hypothetical protein
MVVAGAAPSSVLCRGEENGLEEEKRERRERERIRGEVNAGPAHKWVLTRAQRISGGVFCLYAFRLVKA